MKLLQNEIQKYYPHCLYFIFENTQTRSEGRMIAQIFDNGLLTPNITSQNSFVREPCPSMSLIRDSISPRTITYYVRRLVKAETYPRSAPLQNLEIQLWPNKYTFWNHFALWEVISQIIYFRQAICVVLCSSTWTVIWEQPLYTNIARWCDQRLQLPHRSFIQLYFTLQTVSPTIMWALITI